MEQTKRYQGRRPGKKALTDGRKQTNLNINAMENIRKGGFDGRVEPEIAANMTDVMQCVSSEISEVSLNSARNNTPRGQKSRDRKKK